MDIWNKQLQNSLKTAKECNDFFKINAFQEQKFPIKVPLAFAKLINKSDKKDPLLRQIMPQTHIKIDDTKTQYEFFNTPINDENSSPVKGLIHKYPNKVLLIASQVCAIHCRYCFRQNFNYKQNDIFSNWQKIDKYLRENQQINEVILSGGDPLSLSDKKLKKLIIDIEKIKHINTIRIHSRFLSIIPSRLTIELKNILEKRRVNLVLVLHINHKKEISSEFIQAITQLNIIILNQSVLLKGINDNFQSLSELSLSLFDLKILPYYLHMLDKVKGSQNYYVEDKKAIKLHQQLQANLSGYLVPKLVRDNNGLSKDWLPVANL